MFNFVLSLYQWTPLHWAAYYGKFDAVRILSEKGAHVNIQDGVGVSE